MTDIDLIRQRHSVREYTGTPIEGEQLAGLQTAIARACAESGLHFQLVQNNPEAFEVVARFGLIHGCRDLIVCPISDKSQEEPLGYWGQSIVLEAQRLGLRTCWVGMFAKRKVRADLAPGERARVVIAVGHGAHDGVERATKPLDALATVDPPAPASEPAPSPDSEPPACSSEPTTGLNSEPPAYPSELTPGLDSEPPTCSSEPTSMPAWFSAAMEAAQLAPTALNAQNFHFMLRADGRTVRAEAKPVAFRMIDLGIVKRNFQLAADELGADWCWE